MKDYEVVGHSYNESIFCMDCSAYDAEDLEHDPEDENGNPIHPILAGDEDADSTCDDCGCVLLTGELPEKEACAHNAIDFAQSEPDYKGIMIHVTCRACGVSGSYPIEASDITWPEED